MKYTYTLAIICILFSSCSKGNSGGPKKTDPVDEDTTKVTIKSTDYPVVTIGKQRWTAVNYNGPGGYNVAPAGSSSDWGRLYSRASAMAVPLPAGWRLPTSDDYMALFGYIKKTVGNDYTERIYTELLAAPTGWVLLTGRGQFAAYPYGDIQIETGNIYLHEDLGYVASFWTSSTDIYKGFTCYNSFAIETMSSDPETFPDQITIIPSIPVDTIYHMAVRFVKDVN